MRWQNLFDDLESQLEHELGAEQIDLRAEEERLRLGRLSLRDRIRAMLASPDGGTSTPQLSLVLRDGERMSPAISTIGRDWIAGEIEGTGARRSVVVPLGAIAGILSDAGRPADGLGADPPPESPTSLSSRLGITFVLRDLCRRRAAVDLKIEAERVHGTIDRVGRDHLDLAEHAVGEFRRSSAVAQFRLLPLDGILWVAF